MRDTTIIPHLSSLIPHLLVVQFRGSGATFGARHTGRLSAADLPSLSGVARLLLSFKAVDALGCGFKHTKSVAGCQRLKAIFPGNERGIRHEFLLLSL